LTVTNENQLFLVDAKGACGGLPAISFSYSFK
jgi:hypothetical protein